MFVMNSCGLIVIIDFTRKLYFLFENRTCVLITNTGKYCMFLKDYYHGFLIKMTAYI